jgi:phosphatidylserine/phosphatidylglycerophosphate/cardiolipin synthase-like enzyme
VTVQAIAGTRAVYFGLDLDAAALQDCLGFSVERTSEPGGQAKWVPGFKTFKSIVPNPDPNVTYRSDAFPLQTFYWGDYGARPGHTYTYRVVPRYGTPAALTQRDGVEASVTVTTQDPTTGVHGVYFNRGVAASQAYQREFGAPPDQLTPDKKKAALMWLSRGLLEAILAFIDRANGPGLALRAAAYEFTQTDVLAAFKAAHDAGADVKIVYHARDDSEGNANKAAIAAAGLDASILIERTNAPIAHNKFIVLCTKDGADLAPAAVWTGSTNFSEGGIFGHSNVGHEVRDAAVASAYLDYWTQLSADPVVDDLRTWVSDNSLFAQDAPLEAGIRTVFSPRHGLAPLKWYAARFGGVAVSAHITEAFGMSQLFENALEAAHGDALHYVMLDKPDDHQDAWSTSSQTLVAVGTAGGPDELSRWAREQLTGFNPMVPYLHTKILLVEPTSATPTVVTGSANFSPNSTNENDENMLVIGHDTDVADVYLTEYARIFNHFYARYWAARLHRPGEDDSKNFLSEDASWQDPYEASGPKALQRRLYSSVVDN